MALPSQSDRTQSRHSYTYRRASSFGGRGGRGSRRRPLLLAVAAIAGIAGIVWGYRSLRGPDEPAGPLSALAAQNEAETRSEQASREVATPPRGSMASADRFNSNRPAAQENPPAEKAREPQQPTIRMGEQSPTPSGPVVQTPPPQEEKPAEKVAEKAPEPAQQPLARETSRPTEGATGRAMERLRTGMELIRSNRPIEARRVLTQALDSGALSEREAREVRSALTELNDRLVFSPEIVTDDPFTYGYAVRPGGSLSAIASQERLGVDWRLIQRINRIPRPEQIRSGQQLKLVRGPFHGVVYKRSFRMDLYLGEGSNRVFVRSLPVGLGEFDSTPIGTFRVRTNSKLVNPEWVNPRTGDRFRSDDPKNPIGERWIGLEGISDAVRNLGGYGIHGTIEPDSIGRQASMGCIRMLPEDVELVYELLEEGVSEIEIRE